MGQIKLTISLVFIALFTVAIIGFALQFASDNDASVSIADDPEMVSLYSNQQTSLNNYSEETEGSYQSIVDTTISPDSGTAQSSAPFSVTPINAVRVAKNVMTTGYRKIFGAGGNFSIFLTTLIAIITFMIGLYIYKTLRGNPD